MYKSDCQTILILEIKKGKIAEIVVKHGFSSVNFSYVIHMYVMELALLVSHELNI